MKRIVFLTPADAAWGFRLAGVGQRVVTPQEVETVLLELLRDPQTALAVLDERLLPGIAEERLAELERLRPGLVVVLPAPQRVVTAEEYALRLVQRAIGYQMRLRP
jgi:V/A-type H+-transporting ATPase subunit F